jgi:transposase InsO family protein
MPWTEVSIMDAREEFCQLADQEDRNIRGLCRRFAISPTTGYMWMGRYQTEGRRGLADRSRRPHSSPLRSDSAIEEAVCALRRQHPAWGGRKLRARLLALGTSPPVPSASSITRILQRHGLIDPAQTAQHQPVTRFEAPFPNDLWQMDYKGHVPLARSGRCHPLTVLDDHSRFALGVRALGNEQASTVKAELIRLFARYGLPNRILCDNSAPWGASCVGRYTALGIWLLHLDVPVIHGRPHHPQTQGKDERFHRTLAEELLATRTFDTLEHAQAACDQWRYLYNHLRPHEALDLAPPITRYQPSPRSYPAQLPTIEYPAGTLVRTVKSRGEISLGGRVYFIGEALYHYPVALHETTDPAVYDVFFRHYHVSRIDCREPTEP